MLSIQHLSIQFNFSVTYPLTINTIEILKVSLTFLLHTPYYYQSLTFIIQFIDKKKSGNQ